MNKLLAMMVAVVAMMATGLAQSAKPAIAKTNDGTFVNKAEVQKAAANLKATPALAVSGTASSGYFPVFTDGSGDLTNSALFQVIAPTTTYLGFGTTAPAFNLHFVSTVDPAAVAIDGYGTVGINFIGRRAEGTLLNPSHLLANDNIMAMQGRGYGATAFTPYSRAYMKFFAAENWSDTAQGTYVSLATTTRGTAPATPAAERLRITDAGSVGIGTITPGASITSNLLSLEVNGNMILTKGSGGAITFQDGTTQATAAYNLAAADTSLTVAGTTTAPTIAVNTAAIQARVSGTCSAGSAVTGVTQAGGVSCGTIGATGTVASVPVVVANLALTGSYAAPLLSTTLYTPATTGFYRVTVYMNVPTLGTCTSAPCTSEQITLQWNDGVSTTSLTTATCNLVTPCASSVVTPIWVASGQPITAYGQSYSSGTAPTGGSYNAYVLVEQL
jgi:hypothetical protein